MATGQTTQIEIGGRVLSLETGQVAKQADGAVLVRFGDSVVLATVVASKSAVEGQDFFPLTVDYRERAYAGGRIPGGFFKREGRPMEKEILTSRLIDRPLRPLFPRGFRNEIQVIALAISADQENDPDILAMNGASAAVTVAGLPFLGPFGAVRMGLVDGRLLVNPTESQLGRSSLDLVVAATEESVVMVEAGAKEVPDETLVEAIALAHAECKGLVRAQRALAALAGKPRWPFDDRAHEDPALEARVRSADGARIREIITIPEKVQRGQALVRLADEVTAAVDPDGLRKAKVKEYLDKIEREEVRRAILDGGVRIDGRSPWETRPISAQVSFLPRTHGSALFTRGETQALVAATLGTKSDEQKVEALEGGSFKPFMLHYNFPAFSVGEVRRFGSPGRREIGHGALAERSIQPVLPPREQFPYTIRVVSDILESNGSSSMATVCGASLALMDAGVPILAPVAGIAMGLVKEGDRVAILTDIMGTEDHYGDMDFKVAGTEKGVTGLQMDIKTAGVARGIMAEALRQAREARLYVLSKMREAIAAPRPELSPYAPRFVTIKIKPEKIREVIGPGGKVVRGIQEQTGVKIDIEDDGRVMLFGPDSKMVQQAIDIIHGICKEAEVGRLHLGKVKKVVDFGAFVEIMPGTEGLLHISQIAEERTRRVEDVLSEGDQVLVKVIEVDPSGKIRLSRRAALKDPGAEGIGQEQLSGRPGDGSPPDEVREPRPDRDRGDRDRQRGDRDRGRGYRR
ncbi:MAG: polyribonucleotide nucleotidyltransferase [Candidatus Rokubacteria bacterium]|nr:polyribonucleotide nucleotidyltransferase [Candidatus Rokubacteria bacterium]